ncbi:MAG: glycerophosphodiester phosphodiesterase family protein [Gammaproteobacteria bacterium]|nr:glycerophosphodiester phosphodiesterase family protein [Gammaproteobacteria bacterium]
MSILLSVIATIAACSDMSGTLIAAHRGGMDSAHAENTLPAFEHAARHGAHAIEMDLRATADGSIVVLHDRSVDRTTNGVGHVHELSLAFVKGLDAGGDARIPTLREVIDWATPLDVALLLDMKPAPRLDHGEVVAAIQKAKLEQRAFFGVRSVSDVEHMSSNADGLRFVGFVPDVDAVDDFIAAGIGIIRLWPKWLNERPDLLKRLQRAGIQVWVTTGDAGIERLKTYAAMGIAGLITDRPADAAQALGCVGPAVTGESRQGTSNR